MIISFRHKGLKELFEDGITRGVNAEHVDTLIEQLTFLSEMRNENSIRSRSKWRPHKLHGKNPHGQELEGHWALKVSGNWRITYRFIDGNVELLDYLDYH